MPLPFTGPVTLLDNPAAWIPLADVQLQMSVVISRISLSCRLQEECMDIVYGKEELKDYRVVSASAPTSGWFRPKYSGPAMAVLGGGGSASPAARRASISPLMRFSTCRAADSKAPHGCPVAGSPCNAPLHCY